MDRFFELSLVAEYFNQGGYVLDFNSDGFGVFTYNEIGINIMDCYGLSKGKSLCRFVEDYKKKDLSKVICLLESLLEYERVKGLIINASQHEKMIKIVNKYKSNNFSLLTDEIAKSPLDYISKNGVLIKRSIETGDYDSAITKSRTLIEECFCYGIEKCGEKPPSDGKLNLLRSKFESLYSMEAIKNPSNDIQKNINNLLSGINKIIDALGNLRNINSDAHGVGTSRVALKKHHAKLIVNTSLSLCEFIIDVINNKKDY